MSDPRLHTEPQLIADIRDCGLYHTMEIPGHASTVVGNRTRPAPALEPT